MTANLLDSSNMCWEERCITLHAFVVIPVCDETDVTHQFVKLDWSSLNLTLGNDKENRV